MPLKVSRQIWEVRRRGLEIGAGWWRQRVRDGCCATSSTSQRRPPEGVLDKFDHRSPWTTARPRPASGPNLCGALPLLRLFRPPATRRRGGLRRAGRRCGLLGHRSLDRLDHRSLGQARPPGGSRQAGSGSTRRLRGRILGGLSDAVMGYDGLASWHEQWGRSGPGDRPGQDLRLGRRRGAGARRRHARPRRRGVHRDHGAVRLGQVDPHALLRGPGHRRPPAACSSATASSARSRTRSSPGCGATGSASSSSPSTWCRP